MTTTSVIDEFISKQMDSGVSQSKVEAEKKLMDELVERELDRKIAKGKEDIREGKFTVVNEQTTAEFVSQLSKKIITQK